MKQFYTKWLNKIIMSNYQCEVCGKANIDTPDGYIEECDCLDKTMKPNNISDVIENLEKHLKESAPSMDRFEKAGLLNAVRSQISKLLGRIDTGETTFPEKESDDFDDGYNQKSSEIDLIIKEIIK